MEYADYTGHLAFHVAIVGRSWTSLGLIQGSFSGSIIQACAGRPPIRASQSQERNVRSVETVLLREYGVVLIYRADFYVLAKDGIDTRASTVIFVGWLRRSVHVFCT